MPTINTAQKMLERTNEWVREIHRFVNDIHSRCLAYEPDLQRDHVLRDYLHNLAILDSPCHKVMASRLNAELRDGDILLDVACGTGFLTDVVASMLHNKGFGRNSYILGVDFSGRSIELANFGKRTILVEDARPHVKFLHADVTSANGRAAMQQGPRAHGFDKITSSRGISRMDPTSRSAALRACAQMLKDDGLLLLDWSHTSIVDGVVGRIDLFRPPWAREWGGHFGMSGEELLGANMMIERGSRFLDMSEEQARSELGAAGFVVVEVMRDYLWAEMDGQEGLRSLLDVVAGMDEVAVQKSCVECREGAGSRRWLSGLLPPTVLLVARKRAGM